MCINLCDEAGKKGIEIDYMTLQNEPNATQVWESCLYSAEEEARFAKNEVYPELMKNGIQTKILAWDHNKERLYTRGKEIFSIANDCVCGMAMLGTLACLRAPA